MGIEVPWLKPDRTGQVSPEQVAAAITDKTILISIMAANNEIGTVNPIAEIGKVAKQRGAVLHCAATQVVGRGAASEICACEMHQEPDGLCAFSDRVHQANLARVDHVTVNGQATQRL